MQQKPKELLQNYMPKQCQSNAKHIVYLKNKQVQISTNLLWTKKKPIHVSQLHFVIIIKQKAAYATSCEHLSCNTTNSTYSLNCLIRFNSIQQYEEWRQKGSDIKLIRLKTSICQMAKHIHSIYNGEESNTYDHRNRELPNPFIICNNAHTLKCH